MLRRSQLRLELRHFLAQTRYLQLLRLHLAMPRKCRCRIAAKIAHPVAQRQKLGTGDILEGGLGEGIATSGDMVSKYLIERAEQYQPVVEMPTGIDVEIVFLDGVYVRNSQ